MLELVSFRNGGVTMVRSNIEGRCLDDAPIRIVVNNIIWLQMILHSASDYIVGKVAR